jgi:hypothetical protein
MSKLSKTVQHLHLVL